jgi:uncharacterized protein YukE
MTNTADSDALRARAGALRSLASRLDTSAIHELRAAAGDDTWRGPTADAFVADLRRAERRCDDASEALRAAARTLEHAATGASTAQ